MKTDSARFGMTRLSRDSLSFLQEGYTWRTPIGRVYFILVTQGDARVEINGHLQTFGGDAFLFLLPNMLIDSLLLSPDFQAQCLFFDFDFIADFPLLLKAEISHKASYAPIFIPDSRTANLLRLYFDFIEERYQVPEDNSEILKGLLFSLILEVNRLYARRATKVSVSRSDEITDRFFYLLHRHCKEEHNVAFYAGELCISDKHLMRTIRQKTGQTFHFWLTDFLMREAKLLLKSTDRSIMEIADELHFPNSSFFARFFRKYQGVSPLKFRKGR